MRKLTALLALLLVHVVAYAQIRKDPTAWTISGPTKPAAVGDVVELRIRATIADGWHIYSSDLNPDIGPIPTTIKFTPSATYQLVGNVVPQGVEEKFEQVWDAKVRQFAGTATLVQKIKILKPNPAVALTAEYQACSDKDGVCLPPAEATPALTLKTVAAPANAATTATTTSPLRSATVTAAKPTAPPNVVAPSGGAPSGGASTTLPAERTVPVDSAATTLATAAPDTSVAAEAVATVANAAGTTSGDGSTSLLGFMLAAFLSGLVALLTPCVFPIIPMTVSYFTSQQGGWWKAVVYGLSIILIYVLIGTVVSRVNGPAFANFVSTHWLPNVLFFVVFFVFGLSFLGLFEITLPHALVNRVDARAERGGLGGIFFMAFTLVLVSFSCTGPIVGSLLVASAGGEVVKPIVGMVAFSSAFAVPFTLFAAFPQWLKSLPKSGGWLNAVKVVLGFLELALALKFLSIADQVYHWGLLDREVFLAFWIVIFSLIGFYLLGKIRLPHDSATNVVSIPRLLLAILTFAFVVYMVPGLWGAPLKALAGYLPPQTSQDFNLSTTSGQRSEPAGSLRSDVAVRHGELFRLPHGLTGFFDYKEALAYAKTVNKPVFIDFTGHGCVNCRKMEESVWSDPAVLGRLRTDYVVVALYVDDKTELPEAEWYTSSYDNKVKKTIGAQNADLQIVKYNNNAQPHYCLVDHEGRLLVPPKNYDPNVAGFVQFLDAGKAQFSGS